MKREWTDIKAVESLIIEMREKGKKRQEIADILGLKKVQIKNWVTRYNKVQGRLDGGLPEKRRGRPRKKEITSEAEYQCEINRLKMENRLLRDFLQYTEWK